MLQKQGVFRSFAAGICLLVLFVFMQSAEAAGLQGVRWSSGAEKFRLVLDLDAMPDYKVTTSEDGCQIQIDLPASTDLRALKDLKLSDEMVQSVEVSKNTTGLQVLLRLNQPSDYTVKTLKNPNRLFVDVQRFFETRTNEDMAPGIVKTRYVRRNEQGMLTAYFLTVDPKQYLLRPALANAVIAGRDTVGNMSDQNNALAAVNASYFAPNGEILGLTKLNGTIVSTTYLPRTGIGFFKDGTPFIGQVSYTGTIQAGKTKLPIDGVNCERGENMAVLYNAYYDSRTGTNEYGMEYTIRDGRVIAIQPSNSPLAQGNVVLSVHGTAKDALAKLKVGDAVQITEDLGMPWNQLPQILGVGPRLLKDGEVAVNAEEEQFGQDVAGGRAPRSAVGILPDHQVLIAVVDGRQAQSMGCTLTEMAQLLKSFGVVDAVNFDGGGSSELVVGGKIINSPSDGVERRVGSALLVLKK